MRNVLVPVDLSEMSGPVVERAACIAQSFMSKVWLLHVIPATNESVPFNLDRDVLAGLFTFDRNLLTKRKLDDGRTDADLLLRSRLLQTAAHPGPSEQAVA